MYFRDVDRDGQGARVGASSVATFNLKSIFGPRLAGVLAALPSPSGAASHRDGHGMSEATSSGYAAESFYSATRKNAAAGKQRNLRTL